MKELFKDIPYIEIIFTVGLFFIVERLWEWYRSRRQAKARFNDLIMEVIEEIDYNTGHAIGTPQCHFNLEAHKMLLKEKMLDKELASDLRKLIKDAQLCHSYGGTAQPAVQHSSRSFKDKLNDLLKVLN